MTWVAVRRVLVVAFTPRIGARRGVYAAHPPTASEAMPRTPLDDAALTAAVRDHDDGATVALRVSPRAPTTALTGRHGDALKLKVHAPPVDGAANVEVRRFIAACCGVRPSDVEVRSGDRSRTKVILVRGVDAAHLRAALAG